jgi:glycosyltransferase involved in cell wall biosynthesis
MRVSISVLGRFHAFDLARQLQQRNCLNSLITSYLSSVVRRFGIDPKHINSIGYLDVLARLRKKSPWSIVDDSSANLWFSKQFDQAAIAQLNSECDVFVGWSGSNLKTLQKAKELGAVTIVERGSSHMAYQTEVLKSEYERWGMRFNGTHPELCERELAAYDIADYISIPSLYVKQSFIDKGLSESRLIHVPYGTSLEAFYPVPKEDNTFRVIHCGALSLRKGVQYLLQAFYELNLPDAELWLVGSITPEIMPFVQKYQSDLIILKGHQHQSQLRWFYSQCSVFCLVSLEEGLAMVQPQAMACGLPIIHTTNTGGADIVRDGLDGFCIPIRDVEVLKEKILFLYDNPEVQQAMSKNALEHANTALSWHGYGEKTVNAYTSALARKTC